MKKIYRLMLNLSFISLPVSFSLPSFSASELVNRESSENTTTIINKLVGDDQCMDIAQNKKTVIFNPCSDTNSQKWLIVPASGHNLLKNKTLDDNTCLFSSIDGKTIEMRQCGSGQYNSQTYWSLDKRANEDYSIVSKVQKDFNRNGELSVNSSYRLTLNDATASSGNWLINAIIPDRKMAGTFSILLLNTHFTGATEMPTDKIRAALFGGEGQSSSLIEYVTAASRGALTLKEGKTLDNIDIGSPGNSCNTRGYREMAIKKARERGVNPSDYDLVYIEHTYTGLCKTSAVSTYPTELNIPGKYITVNNSGDKYVMWIHEFGHSLGFRHSRILINCPATETGIKVNGSCTLGGTDGGTNDISDPMGGGGGKMFPVNYMYDIGWITKEQFPVVGNGTYKIEPLLEDRGGNQGLRIARNNASFPYLTLEFRQATKFDSNWPENSPFINGVIVREIRPLQFTSFNAIIHTVPGTTSTRTPPLMPGKTLYDSYSGKLIKVDSVGKDGATVTISDYNEHK